MKRLSSRRQRLALGASAVAALVALWRKSRRRKGGAYVPVEEPAPTGPVVTVRLERKGQPYTGKSDVALTDGATTVRLQPVGGGTYRAEVRPGGYRLVVSGLDADAVVPERAFDVSASGTWPVDVLGADEPFIRLGKAVIPFRARTDLVSVAIGGHGQGESVRRLTSLVVERLGWKRVNPDSGEADERVGDDDGLVSFQATAGAGTDNDIAVLRRLASEAGIDAGDVRVGFLIEGDRPQRAMLDGEFVLRFDPSFVDAAPDAPSSGPIGAAPAGTAPAGASKVNDPASPAAADDRPVPERVVTVLRDLKAELVQPVRGLPLTYLVRFADRDFRRHLLAVERLVRERVLLYGEPNLAARIRDTFSLTDYQANRNSNLDRMGIETAWTVALAAPAPAVPVKVGTLDRGIDTTAKFVDDLQLFDSALNNTPSQVPENDGHGMKVASIASGNGAQGCWGIAPFLPHVAVKRTSTTDVRYWDAFDLGFVPMGVKVISISHESEWLCADQTSQDKVSAYVNAGHVIVVAAGNDDRRLDRLAGAPALVRPDVPFGGNQLVSCPLAAHPRTITVGNTMLNTIQAETFWKVSGANPAQGTNRGDFVDICAFGDGSRAFGPAGGTAFTGTSAAAPLVAGTVALMRYVNPDLTVGQIRAILCTEIDLVQPTDPQWLTIAPTWASPGADWDFTLAPLVGKHNLRYGFGRVNVGKAVTKARSLRP